MSLKSSAKALKADPKAFDAAFGVPVCGIDEVGRGPLAGPVVTACAYIPPDKLGHPVWRDVTDSKKLTPAKRDYLFEIIKHQCVYALAEASAEEVDTLNIHHATLLAMKRDYHGVNEKAQLSLALIDGKFAPAIPCKTQTVVKGDSLSLSTPNSPITAGTPMQDTERWRIWTALRGTALRRTTENPLPLAKSSLLKLLNRLQNLKMFLYRSDSKQFFAFMLLTPTRK